MVPRIQESNLRALTYSGYQIHNPFFEENKGKHRAGGTQERRPALVQVERLAWPRSLLTEAPPCASPVCLHDQIITWPWFLRLLLI